MKNKINSHFVLLSILGIVTFLVLSWTLSRNNYFLFDDIAWLHKVIFSFDIKEYLHILPTSRYNDRPLRTIWFFLMYKCFGLNYQAYYFVVLLWHVVNALLMYRLTGRLLEFVSDGSDPFSNQLRSFIVALFFGTYPKNTMAVFWIAGAANDLLCAFFSLVSLLFYLDYVQKNRSVKYAVLSLAAYILAMRSKEASICLPLIIGLFETYLFIFKKDRSFRLGLLLLLGYMTAFVVKIFSLPSTLTTEGQYKQEFSVLTAIRVLLNYVRMYFGLDDGSFAYGLGWVTTSIGKIGIVICILLGLVIVVWAVKKQYEKALAYTFLFIAVGFAMAPVLVMPNIQHQLYLYFPAIFLSLLFGSFLWEGLSRLPLLGQKKYAMVVILVFAAIGINNVGGAKIIRANFLRWGSEALSTVKEIEQIEPFAPDTHLYLLGVKEYPPNVFEYSPGYIAGIIYMDGSVKAEIMTEQTEPAAPYAIWEYTPGHVREIGRADG